MEKEKERDGTKKNYKKHKNDNNDDFEDYGEE